jgi:predicted nucleotide-binding protein
MSIEFLNNDFERVSYLANLLIARATGLSADSYEFEQLRRELLSNNELLQLLPQWLKLHRNLDSFWGFIKAKFKTYAERRTFISEQFTPVLDHLEFGTIITPPTSSANTIQSKDPNKTSIPIVTRNKRKVFIVHGRDNETKQEVSRFIETIGLEAIILHEQANAGMTIIEKIEHYSNDADFAVILYTACDQGRGIHESKFRPKDRARQNVVFEHGYLMAKLGRENICALVKGNIETPNDISGVVYVPLEFTGAWKTAVAKELVTCGYQLKQWY